MLGVLDEEDHLASRCRSRGRAGRSSIGSVLRVRPERRAGRSRRLVATRSSGAGAGLRAARAMQRPTGPARRPRRRGAAAPEPAEPAPRRRRRRVVADAVARRAPSPSRLARPAGASRTMLSCCDASRLARARPALSPSRRTRSPRTDMTSGPRAPAAWTPDPGLTPAVGRAAVLAIEPLCGPKSVGQEPAAEVSVSGDFASRPRRSGCPALRARPGSMLRVAEQVHHLPHDAGVVRLRERPARMAGKAHAGRVKRSSAIRPSIADAWASRSGVTRAHAGCRGWWRSRSLLRPLVLRRGDDAALVGDPVLAGDRAGDLDAASGLARAILPARPC